MVCVDSVSRKKFGSEENSRSAVEVNQRTALNQIDGYDGRVHGELFGNRRDTFHNAATEGALKVILTNSEICNRVGTH